MEQDTAQTHNLLSDNNELAHSSFRETRSVLIETFAVKYCAAALLIYFSHIDILKAARDGHSESIKDWQRIN